MNARRSGCAIVTLILLIWLLVACGAPGTAPTGGAKVETSDVESPSPTSAIPVATTVRPAAPTQTPLPILPPTNTPTEAAAAASYKLGDVIDRGDLTLAVLGWDLSSGDGKVQPDKGNRFVLVDVMAVNRGSQKQFVSLSWTTLRDADGQQYQVDFNYHLSQPSGFPFDGDLGPGGRVRDRITFQVPEASGGYVLTFSIGGGYTSVELGTEPMTLDPPTELFGAEAQAHHVGQVINQGDLAFSVLGWDLSSGNEEAQPDEGNKFVAVDVVLVNRGDQMEAMSTPALQPKLQDANGYQYKIDERHYVDLGVRGPFERGLSPGERVRGQFLFQVPEASDGYALIFDPAWLFRYNEGGSIITVDLGQQPIVLEPPPELLTPYPGDHRIGDVVTSGDLALTVLGWQSEPGDQDRLRLSEERRVVIVEAVLVNQGRQALDIRQTGLKDWTGQWYSYASLFAEEQLIGPGTTLTDLALVPGERMRGKVAFEVPKDAVGLTFTLDVASSGADIEDVVRLFVALGQEPVTTEPPAGFPEGQTRSVHAIGDAVDAGSFRLTVTGVTFLAEGNFGRPDEGNVFVIVDLTMENIGTTDARVDGSRQMRLKDEKGQYFAPDPKPTGHPVSVELLGNIARGEKVRGRVGFQVPAEARELFLVFQTSLEGVEKVFVSLSQ